MQSTIYNEGRVVGYSAYEIYVRHALSEDPTHTPASELEWLSSSIAMGSSMLLKIPTIPVAGHYFKDFKLPSNTNLAAANTIIGSLFIGEAECDDVGWAQKVTSYGPLLTNNAQYPTTSEVHTHGSEERPTTLTTPLSSAQRSQILEYMKLVDGIVIQPGRWVETNSTPPKDLNPRMDDYPRVRIFFNGAIQHEFYILLTGFTLRTVLSGVSGLDGSTDTTTNMNKNGGFLGPAVFPWANKIVFSVPPAYVNYYLDSRYTRAINQRTSSTSPESLGARKSVHRVSVIDMDSFEDGTVQEYYANEGSKYVAYQLLTGDNPPGDWSTQYTRYYEKVGNDYIAITGATAPAWVADTYYKKINPCIRVDVSECNLVSGDSVLTVYQRNQYLPPALYASKVTATGETLLKPVDTIAPGTVKLYENDTNETQSKALEDEIPGNYALMRDTADYVVKELDDQKNVVPVAETSIVNLDANNPDLAKGVQNVTGKKTSTTISMTDDYGQAYSVVENGSTTLAPTSGNIHWQTLLEALAGNNAIDIFTTIRFLDEFYRAAKTRLLKGSGISFTDDDNAKTRTISANLSAGDGISISDAASPSTVKTISTKINTAKGMVCNTNGLYANFLPGSGINFVTVQDSHGNNAIQISNALVSGVLPQLIPTADYAVDFGTAANCCGKFENPVQPPLPYAGKDHAVTIKYSSSIDGSPANIYISTQGTLGATDFGRSSTGGYSGFWFRHQYETTRQTVSRILRITFTDSGLTKLGLSTTSGISGISDTSAAFTGIWNVFPKQNVTVGSITYAADKQCGESWAAVCKIEQDSNSNNQIYVFGRSYADGYNEQINSHTKIAPDILYSNLINLDVSCQLRP